jgi:NADPH:quinone reductase-like Zn-dependent oxidoreductase
MKAAFRSRYGRHDVLSIRELDTPIPAENEVLIRVYAATVNRSDCHVLWGKPLVMRLFTGIWKPKFAITGSDFAGQIEAIGADVKTFKVGDKVMGFAGGLGYGTHTQYIVFPENKGIVQMPANLDYEQAAACIEGAFYALGAVRALNPTSKQSALVIGATGAIGSATVQFLSMYGIPVTAVCEAENRQLVQSLGATRVIDYKTQDFTQDDHQYDLIVDAVGLYTFSTCRHLLKPNGSYTSSGGVSNLFWALGTRFVGNKKVVFNTSFKIREGLAYIKEKIEGGSLKPVIDRKYPLARVAEAFEYVATGKKLGNVILTMAD